MLTARSHAVENGRNVLVIFEIWMSPCGFYDFTCFVLFSWICPVISFSDLSNAGKVGLFKCVLRCQLSLSSSRKTALKDHVVVTRPLLPQSLQAVFVFLFCLKYVFLSFFLSTCWMWLITPHNVKERTGVEENWRGSKIFKSTCKSYKSVRELEAVVSVVVSNFTLPENTLRLAKNAWEFELKN